MLKDITYCLLLSSLVFLTPQVNAATSTPDYEQLIEASFNSRKAGFANLEHLFLGNSVQLQ